MRRASAAIVALNIGYLTWGLTDLAQLKVDAPQSICNSSTVLMSHSGLVALIERIASPKLF
jgi:hypothetical protein